MSASPRPAAAPRSLGSALREALSWLLFPATVVIVLGTALHALETGVSPSLVAGVGTLVSLAVVASLERLLPYQADWNHSKGDLAADAAYLPTYLGVNALIEPGVRFGAVLAGAALSDALGVGLWPSAWPLLAQFALACVLVEAFDYWPHRLLHEVPALWRFHAIHHNPKRIYWLNATRAHPIEIAFRGFVNVIPLALVGAGEPLIALVALTNSLLGLFQHANVDFRLGLLSWIFSVGEMHRWHHSLEIAEANHNYGSNFLFWDVVFGTRYRDPSQLGPDAIGIQDDRLPSSWWAQMSAPFERR
ncbi:MAG: sterol desaturase family protein [Myxococcota bacterium]|nr:sterol desaturase family protein [Myxococcota bacterium]